MLICLSPVRVNRLAADKPVPPTDTSYTSRIVNFTQIKGPINDEMFFFCQFFEFQYNFRAILYRIYIANVKKYRWQSPRKKSRIQAPEKDPEEWIFLSHNYEPVMS